MALRSLRLRSFFLFLVLSTFSITHCHAAAAEALLFDPPSGWHQAENPDESPYLKLFIVGTGKRGYPPSINICIEPFRGTLPEYLKLVQKINKEEGGVWKDLGAFETAAGKGDLSQLDIKTPFGPLRMLHYILVDHQHAYIFTATARREEFAANYKDFFASLRSLRFGKLPNLDTEQKLTPFLHPILMNYWVTDS